MRDAAATFATTVVSTPTVDKVGEVNHLKDSVPSSLDATAS